MRGLGTLASRSSEAGRPSPGPLIPGGTDVVNLLTIHVALLIGVPSTLIVGPLGAAGTPASLVGMLALTWWVGARLVPDLAMGDAVKPQRTAVMLLSCAILASYVGSFGRHPPYVEVRAADRGLLSLAAWAGVALLAAEGIRSRERLDALLRRLVAWGAVLAAIGMTQFLVGFDLASMIRVPGLTVNADLGFISQRSIYRRVTGTATHPIEFAMVLTLVLPIALHYALAAERGRRLWPWTTAALIAIAIPMSVSRTAVVGLVAGILVLFAGWSPRRRLGALLLAPVFLATLKVVSPGLIGTIADLFTSIGSDPSFKGRTEDYTGSLDYIRAAVLLGRGFRTFIPTEYYFLDNQYLGSLIEIGVVGLVAVLAVFLVGVFTARGARRRSEDEQSRDLAQSLAASLVVAMAGFSTFDTLSFPMASGVIFVLFGSCGALWRLVRHPEAPSTNPPAPAEHAPPVAPAVRR